MTLQLTANDWHGSPLQTLSRGATRLLSWSPYGATAPRSGSDLLLPGFNGERQDPYSAVSHLGNGYRAYSPALRRFTCPDSESPFGVGGINAYAYSNADPVNQTDPSGHGPVTWLLRTVIRAGVRMGLREALADGMATTLAMAGKIETGLALASSAATGIASASLAGSNPQLAAELGWASIGLGLAGVLDDVIELGSRIRKGIKCLSGKSGRVRRKITQGPMFMGGEMKNIHLLDICAYAYEDVYKGGRRLNIVGHGAYTGRLTYLVGDGSDLSKFITPQVLYDYLAATYDMQGLRSIRLLFCDSGTGGYGSFAAILNSLTGVEVKAFDGVVSLSRVIEDDARYILESLVTNEDDIAREYFSTECELNVHKTNPYEPGTEAWHKFRYNPVYFPPRI